MRPKTRHVIIARPGADPRSSARVDRTTALVDAFLEWPEARKLDPTTCSFAIHVASGWLGEQRGFEAHWNELDAEAFLEACRQGLVNPQALPAVLAALCVAFIWMAQEGHMDPPHAQRCIAAIFPEVEQAGRANRKRRRPIQRTRRFHRNWS